ncbi:hypothetical protein O7626_28515 [Micromonospora sp. WMMD1102]|uniref:hypothetical protein n=1 Tax=Micromonospora sp. WMMD1102 TaxID=3016105 RepID=UPI00241581DC|nr:hypothetical protein [Micromonospora sp. WMMD1102]MDG4789823.1 hypothetical protein [Micromonospora sp. WMMD1102]
MINGRPETINGRPLIDRPSPGRPRGAGQDGGASSRTTADGPADTCDPSTTGVVDQTSEATTGQSTGPGNQATVDIRTLAHLLPAARAARAALGNSGRSLSRDALADTMRGDGQGVSNARASVLLKILKAEGTQASATALSKHDPTRPIDWRTFHRAQARATSAEQYSLPLSL